PTRPRCRFTCWSSSSFSPACWSARWPTAGMPRPLPGAGRKPPGRRPRGISSRRPSGSPAPRWRGRGRPTRRRRPLRSSEAGMRVIDAAAVHAALNYSRLIPRLREAFRIGGEVPLRSHFHIDPPAEGIGAGGPGGTLLVMPAWQPGRHIGIKAVSVYPDNATYGLPSVMGASLLFEARTGAPKAVIDGGALTLRRTACASALAADYLARRDARHLLMIGAGSLAPHLVRAHCAVRGYTRIEIWNRNRDRARQMAEKLTDLNASIAVVEDLEASLRVA